jgi:hypothetical protein
MKKEEDHNKQTNKLYLRRWGNGPWAPRSMICFAIFLAPKSQPPVWSVVSVRSQLDLGPPNPLRDSCGSSSDLSSPLTGIISCFFTSSFDSFLLKF